MNHSVWFESGLFNTNSVEGLWSQLKRLTHDFSGLTINTINYLEANGINTQEYLDSWICFGLFLRNVEKL